MIVGSILTTALLAWVLVKGVDRLEKERGADKSGWL